MYCRCKRVKATTLPVRHWKIGLEKRTNHYRGRWRKQSEVCTCIQAQSDQKSAMITHDDTNNEPASVLKWNFRQCAGYYVYCVPATGAAVNCGKHCTNGHWTAAFQDRSPTIRVASSQHIRGHNIVDRRNGQMYTQHLTTR